MNNKVMEVKLEKVFLLRQPKVVAQNNMIQACAMFKNYLRRPRYEKVLSLFRTTVTDVGKTVVDI